MVTGTSEFRASSRLPDDQEEHQRLIKSENIVLGNSGDFNLLCDLQLNYIRMINRNTMPKPTLDSCVLIIYWCQLNSSKDPGDFRG